MPYRSDLPRKLSPEGIAAWTLSLPVPGRIFSTVVIVTSVQLVRWSLNPVFPAEGHPSPLFLAAVILTAFLFGRSCGFLSITLSVPLMAYFYVPPFGTFAMSEPEVISTAIFVVEGLFMTFVVHTMNNNLGDLQRATKDLRTAEQSRALLMSEFRHRIRNDLNALVGLLHLRARATAQAPVREELRAAADHIIALTRIHARLTPDERNGLTVDAREFLVGLCADLRNAQAGEGLRPVALIAEVESHTLTMECAVPLGLVLNEAVTNALKYGFPDDLSGTVHVYFKRVGDQFVLVVKDSGIGLVRQKNEIDTADRASNCSTGLGTRFLRALAAQLRGSFSRHSRADDMGTLVELRFPVGGSYTQYQ